MPVVLWLEDCVLRLLNRKFSLTDCSPDNAALHKFIYLENAVFNGG